MSGLEAVAARPRLPLAHAPTPLEAMARLGAALGGPRLWVKRDDCTGLALGGNKARQLEYYFGEARAAGADTMVITGAVQSNYVRCCAAAAARLGMGCHIQLEDRVAGMGATYHANGNVLLDRLFGAELHAWPEGEDEAGADRALERIAAELRAAGRNPYIVKLGAEHPPIGVCGYIDAAGEMLAQCAAQGIAPDAVVVPTGSGVTHVGTLLGLRLHGSSVPVHGICVRRGAAAQHRRILGVTRLAEALLHCPGTVGERDVICHDDWLGEGYGRLAGSTMEAIRLAARLEGLALDPVYTAKTMAGAIGLVRAGGFAADRNVLVLHTGGAPAIFAYCEALTAAAGAAQD